MIGAVVFDPLLPWTVVWAAAALAVLITGLAFWRGLSGWWLRGLAGLVLVAALANPALQREDRAALSDIVVMVVDGTSSQGLSDRGAQTARATAKVADAVAAMDNTELRTVRVPDAPENGGTRLMTALSETLAELPRARIAGAILVTDGQVHDMKAAPDLPAPLHALLTGRPDDWDRRLVVKTAPAYGILGEPVTLTLRVENQGAVPEAETGRVGLSISIDGERAQTAQVPVGRDLELPVTLPHGGVNVLQFRLAAADGELTDRNNAAVVRINGVRDRLRVLLVSGEPYQGERTWRNLLKSDSSVDLVHFTILRPPDKQDGVPVRELSLIAFPTRELFIDKIDEFDLIVFDRYKRRGILPTVYLDNVRSYVEQGGAVLVTAGPDYASADSIHRSPLGEILPGAPSARVLTEGFTPQITETGARHPVTAGLKAAAGDAAGDDDAPWGRWFRMVEVEAAKGAETVMTGPGDRPLLMLEREGEGRVALLASDQAWLWNRGYEGGGPQLELLKRLAHWMMKEPELEEEALTATAEGQTVTVTRRTLSDSAGEVTVTRPDGSTETLTLERTAPGRFSTTYKGPELGLYRLSDGEKSAVVALGPAAPREFEETIATGDKLAPAVGRTAGGIREISGGVPELRRVRAGRRKAAGRGWIGITPRGAYRTADVALLPLAPAWLFLLLAAGLGVGAWLREGRR